MYRGIMGFGHFGSFCSDEVACGDLSAATEDYEGKSKWLHGFVTFDEVSRFTSQKSDNCKKFLQVQIVPS